MLSKGLVIKTETILQGVKISVTCVMAIIVAMLIGLESPHTAGIITILRIGYFVPNSKLFGGKI